jgi:hypothetical protein
MKVSEAYKNKHGLHKKPPVQVPQKLKVDLTHIDENEEQRNYIDDKSMYESINTNAPPRLARKHSVIESDENTYPNKKLKSLKVKMSFLPCACYTATNVISYQ